MFPIAQIDDVQLAFGSNIEKLLPKKADIPKEFWNGDTKWNKLFSDWFYNGITDVRLIPREGVDQRNALRHIKAVLTSFEPKHEHKEAAVAYLLDQWFESGDWQAAK